MEGGRVQIEKELDALVVDHVPDVDPGVGSRATSGGDQSDKSNHFVGGQTVGVGGRDGDDAAHVKLWNFHPFPASDHVFSFQPLHRRVVEGGIGEKLGKDESVISPTHSMSMVRVRRRRR